MADSRPEGERPPNRALKTVLWMRRYSSLLLVVIGAILGLTFVILLSQTTDLNVMPRRFEFLYLVGFPGMIFLRLLQLIVIPLVMFSIAYAVGSMDTTTSGVLGLRSALYFLVTTMIAATIGITLSLIILTPARIGKMDIGRSEPSQWSEHMWRQLFERMGVEPYKIEGSSNPNFYTLLNTLRNIFTSNIVGAFISQDAFPKNTDQSRPFPGQMVTKSSPNILGLIFIAIMAGALVAKLGGTKQARIILDIMRAVNGMMAVATSWIIKMSPFGVFSLIIENILKSATDLPTLGVSILWYILTTATALILQLFVVLQVCYFLGTRKNPIRFFGGVMEAFVTALATASSNATLPILMHCLVNKNGLDKRVSSFVTSIGATVNMNGTACYEAVAAIFLATMTLPRALSIGDYIIISIASTMAGVGTAGVPGSGIIMMIIVLDSIGVNPAAISLVLPLDVLLDRMRTSVNVMGNAFGAGILNHMMRDELRRLDERERRKEEEEEARRIAALRAQGQDV